MSNHNNHPTDKQTGILAIIARLFWMVFGNFILVISAISILAGKGTTSYVSDVVFWCDVVALVIVRFLDIKFLDGLTTTGKPATLAHWRKYAIMLIICSGLIWAAAHAAVSLFKS
jgi:hypothetical protein